MHIDYPSRRPAASECDCDQSSYINVEVRRPVRKSAELPSIRSRQSHYCHPHGDHRDRGRSRRGHGDDRLCVQCRSALVVDVPDPRRRSEQHAALFGLYVDSALPRGGVWMSDERASAAAVFTHPGEPELNEDSEARVEPLMRESLGPHAPAALETVHRFEAAIPKGQTFYYLSLLGTRADSRGRGVGMGLLAEAHGAGRPRWPTHLSRVQQSGQQPQVRAVWLQRTKPLHHPRRTAHRDDDVAGARRQPLSRANILRWAL